MKENSAENSKLNVDEKIQKTQPTANNVDQTIDEEQNSKTTEWIAIISLLIASFISVFGIYNTFEVSLIHSISEIPETSEKIANYALLGLFTLTMFVMSTIYWKKKDFFSKMQVIGFLILILVIMVGIMAMWINNFLFPFVSLIILGITFFLFNMLFNTIGIIGVFFSITLFSVFMVFMLKIGVGTTASSIFTIIQTFVALLLFLGTTYPRIRSMLFKIGTRDNVELEGSGMQSSHNDNDED